MLLGTFSSLICACFFLITHCLQKVVFPGQKQKQALLVKSSITYLQYSYICIIEVKGKVEGLAYIQTVGTTHTETMYPQNDSFGEILVNGHHNWKIGADSRDI